MRCGSLKAEYRSVRISRALSKTGLYDLDYAYNPYIGCYHGCLYCYARAYTRLREVSTAWGKLIYVKKSALEELSRDINRVRKRGIVGVSTITDPYQPIESRMKLTRRGVEMLLSAGFTVSIQTKSPLVLRDLDIFTHYKDRVDVGVTITTLDNEVAGLIEPNAPSPELRAKAVRELSENSVETWIFLGPIMRGVNDSRENIKAIIELAAETKSKIYYDYFRNKPGLSKSMKKVLERYPGAMSCDESWRRRVSEVVEGICEEHGVAHEAALPKKIQKIKFDGIRR